MILLFLLQRNGKKIRDKNVLMQTNLIQLYCIAALHLVQWITKRFYLFFQNKINNLLRILMNLKICLVTTKKKRNKKKKKTIK